MRRSRPRTGAQGRISRGVAATELALLLPFICFIGMATVDYARLFNSRTTITNCARNAAMYAAYTSGYPQFTSVQKAAAADADGLSSSITATRVPASGYLTDANGNSYVGVTVSYTFQTLINYPGIPSSVPLSRTVYMPVHP